MPDFDDAFRGRLLDLLTWRRDVRRFRPEPLPAGMLDRLLEIASLAPSVGLSQPWRFVVVEEAARRVAIRACFERANADALRALAGETAERYARLKLAGLDRAPVQLAVFADRETAQGRGLGRRTMPEMIEYSVVASIHTLWLAARAYGIGLGWVSILDPAEIAPILDLPRAWSFIGYLCLGYPEQEDQGPELERAGWEKRRRPESFVLRR